MLHKYGDTVDGTNTASVDRWFLPVLGFQPSKVAQDIFHPQYDMLSDSNDSNPNNNRYNI